MKKRCLQWERYIRLNRTVMANLWGADHWERKSNEYSYMNIGRSLRWLWGRNRLGPNPRWLVEVCTGTASSSSSSSDGVSYELRLNTSKKDDMDGTHSKFRADNKYMSKEYRLFRRPKLKSEDNIKMDHKEKVRENVNRQGFWLVFGASNILTEFSWFSLVPQGKIPVYQLQLGQDHFRPHPFQFIIIQSFDAH
jgi:hypothetical protein